MGPGPVHPPEVPVRLPHLSLRQKTLLIVGLTLIGLVTGIYLVSRRVILRSFAQLEEEDTRQQVDRIQSALKDDLQNLNQSTSDYSAWDQSYAYLKGKNPAYQKSEFPSETLSRLNLSLVWITNLSGKVVFTKGFDLVKHQEIPVPDDLSARLLASPQLVHHSDLKSKTMGALLLPEGPMLVDSQPVLTSEAKGPIAGTLLMGRLLSPQEIEHLGEITHLPLKMKRFDDSALPEDFLLARNSLSQQSPSLILPAGRYWISAYQLVDDIYGNPALIFRIRLPRKVYQQGEASLYSFLLSLLAAGLLFGALTLYLLEKMVLSRVARLGESVAAIGSSGELSERLSPKGYDEVANLGREIDRMLAALEKSQEERHGHETRLRLLIERMPAVLWTTDAELRFTSSVGAGLAALHLKPNQAAGKTLFEYFKTQDPQFLPIAAHRRALRGEASNFNIEWSGRMLQSHVEPLRSGDGSIVGVIGIALDTTELAQAEEALARTETSYRSLIEEAPYGICRSTADGKLLLVNRAMVDMLGYPSASELLARNMSRDIYLDPAEHSRLLALLRSKDHIEGIETRWKRKDGKPVIVRAAGRAVREDSRIVYFEVLAENVTERKELEEQLRQAQKMQAVGQLAGGVAHDFNNLLMVVKGHSEILSNRLGSDSPLRENVDQVQKAADRATALTRQLLAFSRMQVLQPRVIDLNHVLADMIQMLPRLIGENIDLVFHPGSNLGRVKADQGQIEQALLNLAVNARDAMPSGGRLTIETTNAEFDESYAHRRPVTEPGEYVMLAVSDTGCGMDAETQSRIFEPFFTTKEPGKGTGLGLSMVYGIVKQSGGFIWVYSEPDHGATFKIYLPRVKEEVEAAAPEKPPVHLTPGTETILLVEDEESVRTLVRNFLCDTGYTVIDARDGAEAADLAGRHKGPIQVLVTDVVMPKMSGRELATRLAEKRPEMKVLFISGYTNDAVVRHGVLEGGMSFLQKPFTLKDLAVKLREVLESSREPALVPPGRRTR